MEKKSNIIIEDLKGYFSFMKESFPLYHDSNIFFRDLHYGVMGYLKRLKIFVGYSESEKITVDVIKKLVEKGILKAIDDRSWLLSYPEFQKKSVKDVPTTAKPQTSNVAISEKSNIPTAASA